MTREVEAAIHLEGDPGSSTFAGISYNKRFSYQFCVKICRTLLHNVDYLYDKYTEERTRLILWRMLNIVDFL